MYTLLSNLMPEPTMLSRTTKTLSNQTHTTVPVVFMFCVCLPKQIHNHGQKNTPFEWPKIATSQILICGKHIQLKIKQRRVSTNQEAVGTNF